MNESMHPPEQPELLIPQALLLRAADDLATRFVGVFGKETVERCVFDSYTALRRTAKITTHLPTLSIHFARERLTAMAQAEGAIVKDVPEVLFVCTHNAGRSVLASSLLSHHAGSSVHVRSAGTAPAATVDPNVTEALAEVGIDALHEFPKPLSDAVVQAADFVITTGCGDACPVYPGKRYLDWDLEDPEGKSLPRVRAIRDDVDAHVRALMVDLAIVPAIKGAPVSDKPSILFACKANAGRSVTGKMLAEYYAGDRADVFSAGSEPGDHVHPEVAAVLASLGLDTGAETPKGFDTGGHYTAVVTMGCGEACPFYAGARYQDWELEDPKGQDQATVRRIVADIDGRVRALLAELVPDLQLAPSLLDTP